jgi:SH3 domain protein
MINLIICLLFVFISTFSIFVEAHAETMYVSDKMKITFRTGPGNDRKITALLTSGQQVEVMQSSGDWVEVQLPDGKLGWVLNQYLTADLPCDMAIENLRQAHQSLTAEAAVLKEENTALKIDKKNLSEALTQNKQELHASKTQHDTLKKESVHFIELKAKYEKTALELSHQKKRGDQLDKELSNALRSQHLNWFLSGAGILIFGMILGFISKKEKRRSSLL